MIFVRIFTLVVLLLASVYVTVVQGVKRFAALTQAPPSMHADLQFWGFVYMFIGALMFTGACTLGFVWLAKALHKRSQ